jgi:hypothetical protein
MASHQDPKDELERLIQESKRKGTQVVNQSRDLLQQGQRITDLAHASEGVLKCLSTSSAVDWKPMIDSWQFLNEQLDNTLVGIKPTIALLTPSSTTPAYAMTYLAQPNTLASFVSTGRQAAARAAAERLGQVIDGLAEKNGVLALLRPYGLDTTISGKKSPIEHFETACAAFETPVTTRNPAATSLIPMRECINGTIQVLLRRRPKQEPAKNREAKILSIGAQLAHNSVSPSAIQSLADRWSDLSDNLSASKQSEYSREEWMTSLRQASLFLIELLQTLDRSKMR